MIEENQQVRIVKEVIEKVNIKPLVKLYKGGGASSYNPKMLLKVLVY
jgi:transposase